MSDLTDKTLSVKELLQIQACTGCRLCVGVCPAVSAAQDGRLSAAYRLDAAAGLVRRRHGLAARILGRRPIPPEEMQNFSGTVFRCTLCANCQEVCPVGLRLKDLWCSLRRDLVLSGAGPAKIETIRDNLSESRNVFGEDNEERAEWVENLREPPEHGYLKDEAEVVYFPGCVAAFYPLAQNIPVALAEVLDRLEVDFTLLGQEEWCCGFPLLGAGLRDRLGEFIEHNIQAVRNKKARQVLFACPSCYQMWREHYPPEFKISHATEFLTERFRQRPDLFQARPLKVTYHDPCDLGRGAGVYDAPRTLIRLIPGVELVELPRNRQDCRCCGGGGNLEMIAPELSAAITAEKIKEALSTGARAVVTSCQQCLRTMTTYVRRNEIDLEVLDVVQLVQRALKPV
ncbi:MAG: (Fe-S)-binding protein [Thermodesulfobacteriota bacterium]